MYVYVSLYVWCLEFFLIFIHTKYVTMLTMHVLCAYLRLNKAPSTFEFKVVAS